MLKEDKYWNTWLEGGGEPTLRDRAVRLAAYTPEKDGFSPHDRQH